MIPNVTRSDFIYLWKLGNIEERPDILFNIPQILLILKLIKNIQRALTRIEITTLK